MLSAGQVMNVVLLDKSVKTDKKPILAMLKDAVQHVRHQANQAEKVKVLILTLVTVCKLTHLTLVPTISNTSDCISLSVILLICPLRTYKHTG